MYISLKWLQDFVDIPKNISKEQLGLLLTMHTLEVEESKDTQDNFEKVVIGKVVEVSDHPKADKLKITQVNIGDKENLQIICGAPNVESGQIVPVALEGAKLVNGMTIEKTTLRGEDSQGMICSENELGLGQDQEGIMVLDKNLKPGKSLVEALDLQDYIYEIENKSITNRPDLWGHYGLAREVATFLNTNLKDYSQTLQSIETPSEEPEELSVKVEDKQACPRYMTARINNLKVTSSPQWLKKRLINVGLRPINSIVDITNYVMLELGQPLHAFNGENINKIEVRQAKKDEVITTLDDKERKLSTDDLVITDKQEPIALAGIMGSKNSGIDESTTNIVLESANFEASILRKTSKSLGLRTDASARFEKRLDPNLCDLALRKAVNLILTVHPEAQLATDMQDIKNYEDNPTKIDISISWLNKRIGQTLSKEKILHILGKLGFSIEEKTEDDLEITVPSWRDTGDINIKEDLLEEVSRIFGYDNIEQTMPEVKMEFPSANKARNYKREIKNILAKQEKFFEVYNYCFVGKNQLNKLNIDYSHYLELAEPLTEYHTLLRQSLLPNLLDNIKLNQSRYSDIRIFEIGSIFLDSPGNYKKLGEKEMETLPYQEEKLALMYASDREDALRMLKTNLESLLSSLLFFMPDIMYTRKEEVLSWSEEKYMADIYVQQQELGYLTKLSTDKADKLNIKKPVYAIEISLPKLYTLVDKFKNMEYKKPEKFPGAERDLSLVVDKSVDFQSLKSEISKFDDLIKHIELFDIYEGEKIGEDKKSLAFHLKFQASDRTLTNEEVEERTNNLVTHLQGIFNLQLRDF